MAEGVLLSNIMPTPKLTKNLSALRDFLLSEGELDKDRVCSQFKIAEADYEPTLRRLQKAYPELGLEFDDEEPTVTPATTPEPVVYKLKGDDAFLRELEVISEKPGQIILAIKTPKELVTIIIKGQPVEVDLLHLRKQPATFTQYGLSVARLIELAELAKA